MTNAAALTAGGVRRLSAFPLGRPGHFRRRSKLHQCPMEHSWNNR